MLTHQHLLSCTDDLLVTKGEGMITANTVYGAIRGQFKLQNLAGM